MASLQLPETLLPESAQELIQVMGADATLALIRSYPGVRYSVPRNFKPEHPLVQIVGESAAKALINHFGGDRIQLPKCEQMLRYQQVKRLLDEGKSVRDVALETYYSERTIYRIKEYLNGESAQQRWDF